MAGNDWVNSYLEAILDVDPGIDGVKSSLLLRERGRFSPTRYFVEQVITGFDETDLHRSWVRAAATRSPQERNTRLENMCWRIWNLARKKKQTSSALERQTLDTWEEARSWKSRGIPVIKSVELAPPHEGPRLKMPIEPQGNSDREQNFFSQMPYHAVFSFLIPLLLEALQAVKDQGTNLWVFLLATIVYCFAFVADIKSQDYNTSYAQFYSLLAVISGSLSSVSLISLFLPELPGRFIFIPWAFVLSIVIFRRLIKRLCCWLYQMIEKTFLQAVGIWDWFKGSDQIELQPRPSV